jgi:hypothetical protein
MKQACITFTIHMYVYAIEFDTMYVDTHDEYCMGISVILHVHLSNLLYS